MKRIIFILLAIGFAGTTAMAAMSSSRVRQETRFLTDKMAYELNLSTPQYNDVYEINYDFIDAIGGLMNEVVRGEEWALEEYYEALDIRNDDLRWVLSESQYRRFLGIDYFYRPISATGRGWSFRIYINYTNHNFFYFGKPYHYRTYCGGHYRRHFHTVSYYRDRHTHFVHYDRPYRTRDSRSYNSHRRSDFGTITMRPNSSNRPGSSVTRPTTPDRGNGSRNETVARPSRDTDRRPETGSNSGRRPSSDRNNSNDRRESTSNRRTESTVNKRPENNTSSRGEVTSGRRTERNSSAEKSGRSSRDNNNSSSRSSERGNSGRR